MESLFNSFDALLGVHEFLNKTYFLFPTWKWIILLGSLALGYIGVKLITQLFKRIIAKKLAQLSHPVIQYLVISGIEKPLGWILVSIFWLEIVESLELKLLGKYLISGGKVFLAAWAIRTAYLVADSFGKYLQEFVSKTESKLDDQLVPFGIKVLKTFIVIFGVLIALQEVGFQVVSLLAGLGLGGLALALAAQDTAANLFGSIMILLDRPFQIGDLVKITDVEGSVEEIGFRSTRLRTATNSVVTLPNSLVAKEKIDNLSARKYRRIRHVFGLEYSTSNQKINQFCDEIRYWCSQLDQCKKDETLVGVNTLGDSSINVVAVFLITVSTVEEEWDLNHQFLLFSLGIAEKLEIEFAFPTRTIFQKNQ